MTVSQLFHQVHNVECGNLFTVVALCDTESKAVVTHDSGCAPDTKKIYIVVVFFFLLVECAITHTFVYTVVNVLHHWQSVMFPWLPLEMKARGIHVSMARKSPLEQPVERNILHHSTSLSANHIAWKWRLSWDAKCVHHDDSGPVKK